MGETYAIQYDNCDYGISSKCPKSILFKDTYDKDGNLEQDHGINTEYDTPECVLANYLIDCRDRLY
jgi:hypothetical protein